MSTYVVVYTNRKGKRARSKARFESKTQARDWAKKRKLKRPIVLSWSYYMQRKDEGYYK